MQDPAFSSAAAAAAAGKPQFPEQEQHLKCPRCESTNTKFCYYNNYNLSQPRHFCKNCRRYWTKGGALRNIPVGGGTRKNSKRSAGAAVADTPPADSSSSPPAATAPASSKRPNSSPAMTTTSPSFTSPPGAQLPKIEALPGLYSISAAEGQVIGMTETFSSLLTSNGHFGNLFESFHHVDHGLLSLPTPSDLSRPTGGVGVVADISQETHPPPPESFIGWSGSGGGSDGSGSDGGAAGGWPNLSIYTPGSSFQ